MILTKENYFSPEAELAYMGSTQYKSFKKCEAAALAKIKGEWTDKKKTALLVGSYVDAHFSKELDIFKAQNPEIFTKNGDLKSDYKKAEQIIARIEKDEMFMKYISGQSQKIMVGEIAGVPFKIKIDSYHPGKALVDMKIMKDFAPIYVEEKGRLNFIEAWEYDTQGAIYQAVEKNRLPFYIAGATKEDEPDIDIFFVPQIQLDFAIEDVIHNAPRYQAIKRGEIQPERCGVCDYCKHTKVLNSVINLWEDVAYA